MSEGVSIAERRGKNEKGKQTNQPQQKELAKQRGGETCLVLLFAVCAFVFNALTKDFIQSNDVRMAKLSQDMNLRTHFLAHVLFLQLATVQDFDSHFCTGGLMGGHWRETHRHVDDIDNSSNNATNTARMFQQMGKECVRPSIAPATAPMARQCQLCRSLAAAPFIRSISLALTFDFAE
jgi:hypothetical protein